MKLDVRLKKNKVLHCFKRRHCEKLCCGRTSQFYICVYIQYRRRRPTDRLHLTFPLSRRNRRSRSGFFQSTDVVVLNFVVVLTFPNIVGEMTNVFHVSFADWQCKQLNHVRISLSSALRSETRDQIALSCAFQGQIGALSIKNHAWGNRWLDVWYILWIGGGYS